MRGDRGPELKALRTRAGLSRQELARLSGINAVTVCHIEKGKSKPRGSTWARLMAPLSRAIREIEGPEAQPAVIRSSYFDQAVSRQEFFQRLPERMPAVLRQLHGDGLVSRLVTMAEFFARSKYYPGDYSTAIEMLGALMKELRKT